MWVGEGIIFPTERGHVTRKREKTQKGAGEQCPPKFMFTQILRIDSHLRREFAGVFWIWVRGSSKAHHELVWH